VCVFCKIARQTGKRKQSKVIFAPSLKKKKAYKDYVQRFYYIILFLLIVMFLKNIGAWYKLK